MENNIEVMKKSDSEVGVDSSALHETINKFHGMSSGRKDGESAIMDTIIALNAAIDACTLSPKAIIAAGKMLDEMLSSYLDTLNPEMITDVPQDVALDRVAQAYKDFLDKRASFVGLQKGLAVRTYVY